MSTDDGYKFYPELDQRKDYFQALSNVLHDKGSEVQWPQEASNVSGDLQQVNALYCIICTGASKWVDNVGTTIMEKEWPAFKEVYNGPALTGDAAKQWDTNMLKNEQTMLQPLYDDLKKQSGWSKDVIRYGGGPRIWKKMGLESSILNEEDRIRYGQQEIDELYRTSESKK